MKTKLRIKIMQDNTKSRELRHISQELGGSLGFNIRIKQKELDKRIDFMKGLIKVLWIKK